MQVAPYMDGMIEVGLHAGWSGTHCHWQSWEVTSTTPSSPSPRAMPVLTTRRARCARLTWSAWTYSSTQRS